MVHMWFICVAEEFGFVNPTKIFARAGPSRDPIATRSICLYLTSLKLNSTPVVAISMRSTKICCGNGGIGRSPLYKALAQMSMVSVKGTLAKRLDTSKEHKKTENRVSLEVALRSVSTKVKESR